MNKKPNTTRLRKHDLHRYAFLALPLSFLGLPLYMHLPKFYHDHYGASLAFIGIILFASRLLDAVIDPLLGVISDRYHFMRKKYFVVFGIGLVISFNGFFYPPHVSSSAFTLIWFALCTVCSYLFYSLIFINYYSLGLGLTNTEKQRFDMSTVRELFSFMGILLAAILPALIVQFYQDELVSFRFYGAVFAGFILLSVFLIPHNKAVIRDKSLQSFDFKQITTVLADKSMRFIIILFFINSIPVAITSNLFNFYVDEVLMMHDKKAVLLLIYFCAAALGAILISNVFPATRKTKKLLWMMIVSAFSFTICCFLNENNSVLFYMVCIASGIGLGGELVIFPTLAADVATKNDCTNTFFGIWASCSKISLAVASGIFLPLVSLSDNFLIAISKQNKLTFMYAIVPLFLKFGSILFLAKNSIPETRNIA